MTALPEELLKILERRMALPIIALLGARIGLNTGYSISDRRLEEYEREK